ncbi:MAG TPA: hypothetical protein VJ821_07135 [Anaerolineales bacterium]|nr:hypothetical protein [Anaerolineales bacterium]
MNLIDRYIAAVGRHLPEKDRSDIEAEIRSMIEDMLDERRERGHGIKSTDEKVIAETLEELGNPRLLAFKYAPPKRYLIGPEWYEGYIKILQRILFTAVPVVAVVMFTLTLAKNPLALGSALGEAAYSVFSVGIQILFWVTLVFVLLERSDEKPEGLPAPGSRAWTIDQLPELPRKRQISIAESVMNIVTYLFGMIWIVLPIAMDWLQTESNPVPFLHPNLWDFWLPVFFVLMGLTLIHEVFQLKIGNWTPALTITNVILGLISILYIAALVITQDVINPAFLDMLATRGAVELREVVTWTVDISAAIIAGIYVWDIIHSIRMARQLREEPSVRNVKSLLAL